MKKQKLKKILGVVVLSCLAVNTVAYGQTIQKPGQTTSFNKENQIKIVINGKEIDAKDAPPYMEDNRVLVPIRVISEALKSPVKWDDKTKNFEVKTVNDKTKENVTVVGKAGSPNVTVNGVAQRLDLNSDKVVVTMKSNRLYSPLRFFASNMGMNIVYSNSTKTVYITDPSSDFKPPVDPNGPIFTPGMPPKDLTNKVPDVIEGATISKGGNQAFVGVNGSQLIVTPTNPYSPNDKGFEFKLVINGWNDPAKNQTPYIVKQNSITMQATKEALSMFTKDYQKVYKELNDAICKDKDNGYTVTTSDGRTFEFSGESAGIIVRIK